MAQLRVEIHLQTIVVGVGFVFGKVMVLKPGVRQARRDVDMERINQVSGRFAASLRWQVDVSVVILMAALVADVAHRQHRLGSEGALHAKAVLVADRRLVIIISKPVMPAGLIG